MEWKEENNKLYKQYKFKDFTATLAFMVQAGFAIEKLNHHPEWKNVYNRLDVWLCTHDAGNTVTDKDHQLASLLDGIYNSFHPL